MRATRYDAEERYELFAKLRASDPTISFDRIMDAILDIEDEREQQGHERMIEQQDEERAD